MPEEDARRDPTRHAPLERRWRYRFTLLTASATLLLMGWGAFVTSIEAGLAVPDWPSSYDSFDPLNPWPGWWRVTPLLAEHGHRLLGMVTGLLTTVLAVWTWRAERRRWLRRLAWAALALVIFQGVLGGLRVIWLSLDLAVVHAITAHLFLGLVAALAVFAHPADRAREAPRWTRLPVSAAGRSGVAALAALFLQIGLGALLRHPGTGIDPVLVVLHIGGATLVAAAFAVFARRIRAGAAAVPALLRGVRMLLALVGVQIALGLTAYFVTLDDAGMLQPTNAQVVVNTAHAVIGAVLTAGTVGAAVALRRRGTRGDRGRSGDDRQADRAIAGGSQQRRESRSRKSRQDSGSGPV